MTEENLVKQLAALDEKRREVKKRLQVLRIRNAATKRKALFKSIRKNEKEVIEIIKTKAPDFFHKLVEGEARKPRAARKGTGRGRPRKAG